jgi:hypothetical protein
MHPHQKEDTYGYFLINCEKLCSWTLTGEKVVIYYTVMYWVQTSNLLYASESLLVSRKMTQLQTFINRCLWRILKDRCQETISNQDLWRRTAQVPVEEEIKRKNWDGWGIHCGNLMQCKLNGSWMESTRFTMNLMNLTVPGEYQLKLRPKLLVWTGMGEDGSEEQSSEAVCGGCPMLQIGFTGNTDWLTDH